MVRPVPFGRLGASDLTDAEIIELAMADNPHGKITGTGLRKDFGIGPGRGARIRNEIARRRLAARLAGALRDQIERLRAADNSEDAEPAGTFGVRPTFPDSADMGDTIKTPSQLSRQGS